MSCADIFTDDEQAIIEKQADELELSPKQWLRLAAAYYQMHNKRIADGETCTYSGDEKRAREFAGTDMPE